jgi:type IV pilus assembly protein PilB
MLGIDALGYEPAQRAALNANRSAPYGMILVTGPTGSGKTVSLYTCLNILNQPGVNIRPPKIRRKSTCPASIRST